MIKYRIVDILYDIIRKCSTHQLITNGDIEQIKTSPESLSYFNLSSNPIIFISAQDSILYFRECRKHKDYVSFVKESIDKFFYMVKQPSKIDNFAQEIPISHSFSVEYVEGFKEYIDGCVREYNFVEKVSSISKILKRIRFSIWDGNYMVPQKELNDLGLNNFPHIYREILPLFLIYMRSGTNGWKGKAGTYECYNACRSIASAKIAELLEVQSIYTSARLVKLKVDKFHFVGVLSNKALGIRAMDSTVLPTPLLQEQLSILNVVDVLCCQKDHWVNNYNVVLDEDGTAIGVCAFDNDNDKTFSPFNGINITCYHGGCTFLDKHGLIAMPHLNKEFANKVLSLSFNDVWKVTAPYLNKLQMIALAYRLYALKNTIKKTSSVRENFLLSSSEFNINTLNDELSGKYGRTYLYQYANKHLNR